METTNSPSEFAHAWRAARAFPEFLERVEANRELWLTFADRARVPAEVRESIDKLEGCLRILVLADDWCGDAINTVPVIARMAEDSKHVALRVLARDRFPRIRDRFLTDGNRAIPIAVVLDDAWVPRGRWGPRPAELQDLVTTRFCGMDRPDRYREIRRWYACDRGVTTAREILDLLNQAASTNAEPVSPPCREQRAA